LESRKFASQVGMELIDGSTLLHEAGHANHIAPAATPTCPKCAASMVLRTARRGRRGQNFWGCSSFPGCTGTRAS
jgi:hypothetical protein